MQLIRSLKKPLQCLEYFKIKRYNFGKSKKEKKNGRTAFKMTVIKIHKFNSLYRDILEPWDRKKTHDVLRL